MTHLKARLLRVSQVVNALFRPSLCSLLFGNPWTTPSTLSTNTTSSWSVFLFPFSSFFFSDFRLFLWVTGPSQPPKEYADASRDLQIHVLPPVHLHHSTESWVRKKKKKKLDTHKNTQTSRREHGWRGMAHQDHQDEATSRQHRQIDSVIISQDQAVFCLSLFVPSSSPTTTRLLFPFSFLFACLAALWRMNE